MNNIHGILKKIEAISELQLRYANILYVKACAKIKHKVCHRDCNKALSEIASRPNIECFIFHVRQCLKWFMELPSGSLQPYTLTRIVWIINGNSGVSCCSRLSFPYLGDFGYSPQLTVAHGEGIPWYCQNSSVYFNECNSNVTFSHPSAKHVCMAIKAIHCWNLILAGVIYHSVQSDTRTSDSWFPHRPSGWSYVGNCLQRVHNKALRVPYCNK